MKPVVALGLIVAGVILIGLPPLSDFLMQRNVVRLLEIHDAGHLSLVGRMGDTYRFGCWVAGAALLVVATLASLRPARSDV